MLVLSTMYCSLVWSGRVPGLLMLRQHVDPRHMPSSAPLPDQPSPQSLALRAKYEVNAIIIYS
jgi:hypothetical protein